MLFLLSIQEPSSTESSVLLTAEDVSDSQAVEAQVDEVVETSEPVAASTPSPSFSARAGHSRKVKRSDRDLSELEREIMGELKKSKCESEPSFFGSFEQYVSDMTETEKLELHSAVLQSIMDIKRKRLNTVYIVNNDNYQNEF